MAFILLYNLHFISVERLFGKKKRKGRSWQKKKYYGRIKIIDRVKIFNPRTWKGRKKSLFYPFTKERGKERKEKTISNKVLQTIHPVPLNVIYVHPFFFLYSRCCFFFPPRNKLLSFLCTSPSGNDFIFVNYLTIRVHWHCICCEISHAEPLTCCSFLPRTRMQ